MKIYAQYEKRDPAKYVVSFYDWDGNLIRAQQVGYYYPLYYCHHPVFCCHPAFCRHPDHPGHPGYRQWIRKEKAICF